MSDFADQVQIVVGAGSGIGRAVSGLLAARGANVVCLDRDRDSATQTAERIAEQGGSADGGYCDVSVEESVAKAFADVMHRHGRIDGLLNCAGITGTTGTTVDGVDVADFDQVYSVNLRGSFLVTKHVIGYMVARKYGRIVHMASVAGKEGNAGMGAYSATKAGVIGLVKAVGKEYATSGVTINAIAPAVIDTPMVAAMPPEQVRYMTDKIPMHRLCSLPEISELAAFCLSSACSFTTGFVFDATGGRATY
ncbi:MAG: SDR family NAD(P)-dependent oxidoreductase [Microbacteriaceae bacterium]